jgi:hypothetical protein
VSNQLSVKKVPFMGDELMAAKDEKTGKIYAGVSYICRGIGFDKNFKDAEVKRVQRDIVLKRGCVKFDAGVFDPNNETIAIDNDFIPLWLAKISITPTMKKEHPEVADKLVQYQLKAQKVLANAFLHPDKTPSTKSKYRALPPVNHSVEILQKAWIAAGVDKKRAAAAVSAIYKQVYSDIGINIPSIPVKCEKTYDKEQIAKVLGVYSKSGKPHSQAIAAIMRTLYISPELIEHSPFASNGHSDDYDRYKAPVLRMVQKWIIEHHYPNLIQLDKSYRVVYRQGVSGQ